MIDLWKETYKNRKKLIYRDDVQMLFNPKNGLQLHLNDLGDLIINNIYNGKGKEETIEDILKEFADVNYIEVSKDIEEFLKELRVEEVDELPFQQFEKTINKKKLKAPYAIEIELTRLCNLKCSFCYNIWKYKKNDNDKMNYNLSIEKVKEILNTCRDNKILRIRYSGGEPTLYPNFDKVVKYGSKLGFYQIIFTNGLLINRQKAKYWKNNNVKEVMISLHGSKQKHDELTGKIGSYDSAIKAIDVCQKEGLKVVIEMTLNSKNIMDIVSTIRLVKGMGIKEFRIMKYVPTGNNDDELIVNDKNMKNVLDILKDNNNFDINILFPCSQKFCMQGNNLTIEDLNNLSEYFLQSCNAGVTWLSISYDGFIRICPHSDKYFGNIMEGDMIKDIWKNKIKPYSLRRYSENKKKCGNCIAFDKCMGGCIK